MTSIARLIELIASQYDPYFVSKVALKLCIQIQSSNQTLFGFSCWSISQNSQLIAEFNDLKLIEVKPIEYSHWAMLKRSPGKFISVFNSFSTLFALQRAILRDLRVRMVFESFEKQKAFLSNNLYIMQKYLSPLITRSVFRVNILTGPVSHFRALAGQFFERSFSERLRHVSK